MRCVACGAAFGLKRSMFEYERALLVAVALDTNYIRSNSELGLFGFEPAVRIVAIAALHCPFEDLVVKRLAELRSCFRVTAHTELRFAALEHFHRGDAGILPRRRSNICDRTIDRIPKSGSVRAVAVGAADIISPMFSATEIIMTFLAGVTAKTGF